MLSVSVGGLALPVGRVVLAIAFGITLIAAGLSGRRYRVAVGETLWSMLWVALIAARLAFVAMYFEQYRGSPWQMIDIRDGGFSPLAGVLAAALVGGLQAWRRPTLRRPLLVAVSAGAITWGAATAGLTLIDRSSRGLPAVPLETLDGEATSLKALSGHPMVVNLWATWCPPCRREMPILQKAQRERPGIRFVFVNQGEAPGTIRQYLMSEKLVLRNILRDPTARLGRRVGSSALPTTLFYNAEGQLVDSHLGELSAATLAQGLARLRAESKTDNASKKD